MMEWGKRRQPGYGAHKRGINSKIHLAVDAHGMPVRMAVTSGTVADCTKACSLIEGIGAKYLLADKGYDSEAFVEKVEENGSTAVIPPHKNRKKQRDYDNYLYKLRHFVGNSFQVLKQWRGVTTKYIVATVNWYHSSS